MITGWRMVTKSRERAAFSGEGARRYGGRWNHRGTKVVYISDCLSLAALEIFVHLPAAAEGMRFATFTVEIPDEITVESLSEDARPKNWRAQPAPDSCKDIGTQWVGEGRAAVLQVPSVIVPVQGNFVLNVNHPGFRKLRITRQADFSFDPRMWK